MGGTNSYSKCPRVRIWGGRISTFTALFRGFPQPFQAMSFIMSQNMPFPIPSSSPFISSCYPSSCLCHWTKSWIFIVPDLPQASCHEDVSASGGTASYMRSLRSHEVEIDVSKKSRCGRHVYILMVFFNPSKQIDIYLKIGPNRFLVLPS